MSYNGWSNWGTWNVALWVDNEESIYRCRIAQQSQYEWTAATTEEFCVGYFPDGTPDMDSPTELDDVDWQEIADNWNEETEKEDTDSDEDVDPGSEPENFNEACLVLEGNSFTPIDDNGKFWKLCEYKLDMADFRDIHTQTGKHYYIYRHSYKGWQEIAAFKHLQDAIAFCENV